MKKKKAPVSKPVSQRTVSKKPVAETKKKGGYAVEVLNVIKDQNQQVVSSGFIAYVGSKKSPLTLQAAESHRDGLKRAGSAGRIISVPDGEVQETWEGVTEVEAAQREEALAQNPTTDAPVEASSEPVAAENKA